MYYTRVPIMGSHNLAEIFKELKSFAFADLACNIVAQNTQNVNGFLFLGSVFFLVINSFL